MARILQCGSRLNTFRAIRSNTRHENQESRPGSRPLGGGGSRDLHGRNDGATSAGSATTSTAASFRRTRRPTPASTTRTTAASISAPGVPTSVKVSRRTSTSVSRAATNSPTRSATRATTTRTTSTTRTTKSTSASVTASSRSTSRSASGTGSARSQDYTFTSITISPEKGPYYKFGRLSDDFETTYVPDPKTGPGGSATTSSSATRTAIEDAGVDLSIAYVYSDDLVVGDCRRRRDGGDCDGRRSASRRPSASASDPT